MDGRHFVRLIVAAIVAFDGVRAERHQTLEDRVINGELDDRPAGDPPNDIAAFEDSM